MTRSYALSGGTPPSGVLPPTIPMEQFCPCLLIQCPLLASADEGALQVPLALASLGGQLATARATPSSLREGTPTSAVRQEPVAAALA